MKELITLDQANQLMLAATVIIPVVGAIVGMVSRRLRVGIAWGLALGIGNLVLWKVYNAITDRLGLDTVENLLVNLGLFVAVGLVVGIAVGLNARRSLSKGETGGDGSGGVEAALVGGPAPRAPGGVRTIEDASQPPRDAG